MDNHNKPKLDIQSQIKSHMKNKAIAFNIVNEESAIHFLTNNSYFFKLKSYAKNYDKKPNGQYINLEFAALQELSTIDMYLRRFIIRLTLDIEHFLKTKLLRDFNQDNCDGYEIVDKFLNKNIKVRNNLLNHRSSGYSAKDNILKKYRTDLSIWNLVEILDFGIFVKFCDFYYYSYPNSDYETIKDMLYSVKRLRNSSAHNNCLIYNLRSIRGIRVDFQSLNFLSKNIAVSRRTIQKKITNPVIKDFIITLRVYKSLCKSPGMLRNFKKDLLSLFIGRLRRNKKYFEKNTLIVSSYDFTIKSILAIF